MKKIVKKVNSKICSRGHKYEGSGPCPICWPGRLKREIAKIQTICHKDGSIWAKGEMKNGKCDGYWEWFRKPTQGKKIGTKMRSGNFKNGKKIGEWITYNSSGKVYKVTNIK